MSEINGYKVLRGTEFGAEADPHGKSLNTPGAKADAGKNMLGLVLGDFARAVEAVGLVGTYGAGKYSKSGWLSVPEGLDRYTDAMYRHLFAEAKGEANDPDTGIAHAAHACWNSLARLELLLRERAKVRN